MLDLEKLRRPRSEEQDEIDSLLGRAVVEAGVLRPSLADEVAWREAEEVARLDARDREETGEERAADERLRREEAEILAEIPLLRARQRRC